jgi:geranylgeranyl diphosphate synthase type II
MHYVLELGGKRIRPVLTLISADGYNNKSHEALSAAMSVEVFHNFTLLHDDIMDQAPIRRGKPTVHEKWDNNTAILSGDVMLIKAFQYLEEYKPETFKELTQVLSKTAVEVCEGQQYDMDFEKRKDVTLSEYLKMIELKTAVLLGAALQMGAIVAEASKLEQLKIYEFGVQLGLAFQMQDDFLDTFGSEETFGKKIGGDILENKKTWLYLKTLELADYEDKKELLTLYSSNLHNSLKIEKVKNLFLKYQVNSLIQEKMMEYTLSTKRILSELSINSTQKIVLETLINKLENREN